MYFWVWGKLRTAPKGASDFYTQCAAPSHDESIHFTCNAAAVLTLGLKLAKARDNNRDYRDILQRFKKDLWFYFWVFEW